MNLKKIIIAAVVGMFVVPAMASAYTSTGEEYDRATETLVEGHTVFATIQATLCIENLGDKGVDENGDPYDDEQKVKCPGGGSGSDFDVSWDVRANVTVQRLGAAVAVLVRDRVKAYVAPSTETTCQTNRDVVATVFYENPAVLWFNDQFLVGDDLDIVETRVDANLDVCKRDSTVIFDKSSLAWRHPCGGWILATQAGNPDPRGLMGAWSYTESYQITDPNDNLWTIDKYSLLPAAASVTLPNDDIMHDVPGLDDDTDGDDHVDGDVRALVKDEDGAPLSFHLGRINMWSVPVMMLDTVDPGPTSGCNTPAHTDLHGGDDTSRQYNGVLFFFFEDLVASSVKEHGEGGLHDADVSGCDASTNPCPGGDDDAEGNSHPYNAGAPDSGPRHVHSTADVDLYFSNVQPTTPATRKYAVFDTVGSGAPMHAHQAGLEFDDRVLYELCGDVDYHQYKDDHVFNGDGSWTSSSNETESEVFREGEGESAPGDRTNTDDCTGGYDPTPDGTTGDPDGGHTGWNTTGEADDGSSVPTEEPPY